jgi:uncharacterized membrane protein
MARRSDLLLIIGLTISHAALVLLNVTGTVRVASGFIFLALLPGYSLLSLCYRRYRQDYNVLEQVVLAVPVSLAMNAILGMLMNMLGLSIRPEVLVTWLALLTGGLAAGAIVRVPAEHRVDLRFAAVIGGLVGIALCLGVVSQYIAPPSSRDVVSLYVLDASGRTEAYPAAARVDVPLQVRVGVSYQGHSAQQFELVSSTGTRLALGLQPGEMWQETVDVTFANPGLQQVSWQLYRSDAAVPERSVQLWIDVQQ